MLAVLVAASLSLSIVGCGGVVITSETGDMSDNMTEMSTDAGTENDVDAIEGEVNDSASRGPARAQDDYYSFINQEIIENYEITYQDSTAGPAMDMTKDIDQELYEMILDITESNKAYAPGSNEQLVREGYQQMLAYYQGEKSSAGDYFREWSDKILKANSLDEFTAIEMQLIDEGLSGYFKAFVDNDFYDGKSYALYLEQQVDIVGCEYEAIYKYDSARQQLHSMAMEVLVAAGLNPEDATKKADEFVYRNIDIACDTDFDIMNDPNVFLTFQFKTNKEMNEILDGITIEEIEKIYQIDNPYGGWYIQDETQLASISRIYSEENLDSLKIFLLLDMMKNYQEYLRQDYPALELFHLDKGYEVEKEAALAMVDIFTDEVSELYADYYYTEEMNRQIHKMYDDIISGYRKLITEATWLSEETRKALLDKLEKMIFVCGGGKRHEVKASDSELIGIDIFETHRNVLQRKIDKYRAYIGTEVDKEVSIMSSMVVNSAYSPCNTFTITVGIMKAPYFDVNADYATNMGGLGMVMAHEIGHAFDSNCIVYDADGKYDPDRISKEDWDKLEARLKAIEDYYSSYSVMDIYYVDGELTSSENYADKGALECLMKVITLPEDREKLFENYAYIWCDLVEDVNLWDQLYKDVHSPSEVRVNAVLSSTEEFYEMYDLQPGDGMYVAPEKRVSRWY